jgi:hypothetical protein
MGGYRGGAGALACVLALACAACAGARGGGAPPRSREEPEEGRRRAPRDREEPGERTATPETPVGTPAGKAPPSRVRGVFDISFGEPFTHGRVAMDGSSASAVGSPRSEVFSLDLDILFGKWMASHELSTTFLPAGLGLAEPSSPLSTVRSHYGNWDLVLGPKVLEIPAETGGTSRPGRSPSPTFRLDAFAGVRFHRFSEWDGFRGFLPGSHGSVGWTDPIAGLRAEWMATGDLAFRLRGDTKFSGVGSDHAWRASAAVVFWASRGASLTLGWAASSIHFERGRGRGAVRYDVLLDGPFLALEIRF